MLEITAIASEFGNSAKIIVPRRSREIDIVTGDDIFHHGLLLMYSTGKSAALDSASSMLRRLVMMLGTTDELAAAFVEAPTLAGRAA